MSTVSGMFHLAQNLQERYLFVGKLGSGGMADVFLGVQRGDEGFEHLVVIKKISTHWMKEENAIKMFIEEARTVASLNHPHIIKVFDLSKMKDDICIAMEYVDGENLEYLAHSLDKTNKSFPLPIVCRIILQACEALHYAHSAQAPDGRSLNLIHRDVGPHNLMLDRNGYLKVIDFGIAKSATQVDLTTPGMIKGKLSYLAPDIFKFKDVDGRIDLYALGLVLYRLATLKVPYPFKNDVTVAEVVEKLFNEPLPKPSTIASTLPKMFDDIIAKATHKDRNARYQTGEEFADDLRRFAETHQGLANAADVKNWFQRQFKSRIALRREFERRALEKARSMSLKSLEDSQVFSQSSLRSIPEMAPLRSASPISTSTTVPAARRHLGFYILLAAFLLLAGGGTIAYLLFQKNLASSQSELAQPTKNLSDNLRVLSIPAQADLSINGERVGSTGAEGFSIWVEPGKEHHIEVRKKGYKPYIINARGVEFGQRVIEAQLVAEASVPAVIQRESKVIGVVPPKVLDATRPEPEKKHEPPTKIAKRSWLPSFKPVTSPPERANPNTEAQERPPPEEKPLPAVEERKAKPESMPVETKTSPTTEPPSPSGLKPQEQALPTVAARPPVLPPEKPKTIEPPKAPEPREPPKVAVSQKARWLSGNGSWSGEQVITQGCARCHNGSKLPALKLSIKTKNQWSYFFSRRRHDGYFKLEQAFSSPELVRGLKYIHEQLESGKKSGVAGVKE